MYLRGRIQIDEDNNQVHSILERGYVVGVFPQGVDAELTDGVRAVGEYTACHEIVAHPEWPGGSAGGFARLGTDFPVVPGDFYWLEAAVQGDDDGQIEITDAIRALGYLFLGGSAPPAPDPETCGVDPTTDDALEPCVYEPPAGGECP
jgi:hypothetical protein